ncbi:hypothetical protein T05_14136 [Trichinella murrelli]|uniref:Uncharacterized protein n=1 Tax=Trichinella murrelli TaxID=144512 RepID=A0A0V0TG65_9BILA|nr:hypothetical protein T05_14136 [Trichinella murrelli]
MKYLSKCFDICFTIYYNRSRIQLVTVEKQKHCYSSVVNNVTIYSMCTVKHAYIIEKGFEIFSLMMIIIVTFYTDQQMIIAHLRISTCELKNDFEKYSIQS